MTQRHGDDGQTMVEFALILPAFLLILVGLFDAGRAIYAYNTVANAARVGARVAIVHQDTALVEAAAREHAVSLGQTRVAVTLDPCGTSGCRYGVTVEYDYEPITPLIGGIFNPTISSTAEMPVENLDP